MGRGIPPSMKWAICAAANSDPSAPGVGTASPDITMRGVKLPRQNEHTEAHYEVERWKAGARDPRGRTRSWRDCQSHCARLRVDRDESSPTTWEAHKALARNVKRPRHVRRRARSCRQMLRKRLRQACRHLELVHIHGCPRAYWLAGMRVPRRVVYRAPFSRPPDRVYEVGDAMLHSEHMPA